MSFKWTPSQLQTDNVVDADAFNDRYDQLKSELNGNLTRDQIPERSITKDMAKAQSFYRFQCNKLRFPNDYRKVTTFYTMPCCQYGEYSGGLVRSNSYTIDCVEGMLHVEASLCYYIQSDLPSPGEHYSMMPGMQIWGEFQLLVNSVPVVAPLFKVWHRGGTVYMVGDVPVTDGIQTVQFFWGAQPPGEIADLSGGGTTTSPTDKPVFFFDGGTLLLINRYR